jgi:hypothetical protein
MPGERKEGRQLPSDKQQNVYVTLRAEINNYVQTDTRAHEQQHGETTRQLAI